MGISIADQLAASISLVLSFRANAEFRLGAAEVKSRTRGDLRFRIGNGGLILRQCFCERSGFVADSVSRGEVRSGNIGVSGLEGPGLLQRFLPGRWKLRVQLLRGRVFYKALAQSASTRVMGSDMLVAPGETFAGYLEAILSEESDEAWDNLVVAAGNLELFAARRGGSLIDEIRVPLEGASLRLWPRVRRVRKELARAECGDLRQITLRPVGFFASEETKSQHTATSWSTQFPAAKELWKKCCIELIDEKPHLIRNEGMMTSTSIETIAAQWEDPDSSIIEVFFVDSNLGGGGGMTSLAGTGRDKIVMTKKATNDLLLAHELGHVFGGLDPCSCPKKKDEGGCKCPEESWQWLGSLETILEPSNSPYLRNSDRLIPSYCLDAYNPKLFSAAKECCFSVEG